jgi:hypothetical protein
MSEALRTHEFMGACCPEMQEALRHSPDSSRMTESMLFLAVERHIVLDAKTGSADLNRSHESQAVFCCPFCGKCLQG